MTAPAIGRRFAHAATGSTGAVSRALHPKHALAVAILTIATVGVRVHENIPLVHLVRPVVLAAYGGLFWLLTQSSAAMFRNATEDKAFKLILAYFGWAIVTAPFALWAGLAVQLTVICFPIVIMCLAVMLCRPDRETLDKCIIGLVVAVSLLGLATVARRPAEGQRLSAEGTFDPNDLAAVAALCFPFALGLIARGSRKSRLLGIVAAGLCPFVVIATSSRGGTMAIVAGSLIFALGSRGNRRVVLIVALVAGAVGAWTFAPDSFRDRMRSISALNQDYNTTEYTGRKQIWGRGIGYLIQHPIAGVGLGNFPIAEGGHAERIGIRTKWSAAHNAYVQAFAELGLVGGGLFVAIFVVALRRAWRLWRPREASAKALHMPEFLASLVSFGVSAYFLSHAYFGLFFALVCLTSLATRANAVAEARPQAPPVRGVAAARLARMQGRRSVFG